MSLPLFVDDAESDAGMRVASPTHAEDEFASGESTPQSEEPPWSTPEGSVAAPAEEEALASYPSNRVSFTRSHAASLAPGDRDSDSDSDSVSWHVSTARSFSAYPRYFTPTVKRRRLRVPGDAPQAGPALTKSCVPKHIQLPELPARLDFAPMHATAKGAPLELFRAVQSLSNVTKEIWLATFLRQSLSHSAPLKPGGYPTFDPGSTNFDKCDPVRFLECFERHATVLQLPVRDWTRMICLVCVSPDVRICIYEEFVRTDLSFQEVRPLFIARFRRMDSAAVSFRELLDESFRRQALQPVSAFLAHWRKQVSRAEQDIDNTVYVWMLIQRLGSPFSEAIPECFLHESMHDPLFIPTYQWVAGAALVKERSMQFVDAVAPHAAPAPHKLKRPVQPRGVGSHTVAQSAPTPELRPHGEDQVFALMISLNPSVQGSHAHGLAGDPGQDDDGADLSPSPLTLSTTKAVNDAPQGRRLLLGKFVINSSRRAYALLDSGAEINGIDVKLVEDLGLTVQPRTGVMTLFDGSTAPRRGVVSIRLCYMVRGAPFEREVQLDVIPSSKFPIILGLRTMSLFGIGLTGVSENFPPLEVASGEDLKKVVSDDKKPSATDGWNLHATDNEGSSATAFQDQAKVELRRLPTEQLQQLLHALKDELAANEKLPPNSRCTHPAAEVKLDLKPGTKPVYKRQYPLSEEAHAAVDKQVEDWILNDVVVPAPVTSPWNSPLLRVRKKDQFGQWSASRVCIDPRHINEVLLSQDLPLPDIQDILRRLFGFKVASSLDIKSAFTQCPVRSTDQFILTFTHKGKRYMFQGTPYGLTPLSGHYQRLIEVILEGCEDFIIIYVDDIVIFSLSLEEHVHHCKSVLQRLTFWNLRLNISKCHFGCIELLVLGHLMSGESRVPDPAKVDTAATWPRPTNLKQLQALVGFFNYLREYIPLYATVMAPLERLKSASDVAAKWDAACEDSFRILVGVLKHGVVLSYPRAGVQLRVATDASKFGVSAVLYQEHEGTLHYISFVSKALNAGQLNYSATKRELLAIVFALQRLRHWLQGRHFVLRSDHSALTFWRTQPVLSPMLIDWLDVLTEFSFDIQHCPGILNVLPDRMSRLYPERLWNPHYEGVDNVPTIHAASSAVTTAAAKATSSPVRLEQFVKYPERELAAFIEQRLDKKLPEAKERVPLLDAAHAAGHFGAEQLYKALWRDGWWWPGMRAEAFLHVSRCVECLRYNITRSGFHPMVTVKADGPNDHWSVDLFSFGVASPRGNNYVLLVVCIFSRYAWLVNLTDKRTITVARALWSIIASFGPPKVIQSDRGPEFVSQVIEALATIFGIDQRLIAAYNPRANGSAESHVKVAKAIFRKTIGAFTTQFDLYTAAVQYCMNFRRIASLHGSTPADVFFGRASNKLVDYSDAKQDAIMPSDGLRPEVQQTLEVLYPAIAQASASTQADTARRAHEHRQVHEASLPAGTRVMVRDPRWERRQLDALYTGPFEVVERQGNSYRLVDATTRALLKRAVPRDQLKIISFPEHLDPDALADDVKSRDAKAGDAESKDAKSKDAKSKDVKSKDAPPLAVLGPTPSQQPGASVPPPPPRRSARGKPRPVSAVPSASPDQVHFVEEILQHEDSSKRGKRYLIRWRGYPDPKDQTWEPAGNIPQHLLDSYHSDQVPVVRGDDVPRLRKRRAAAP